VSRPLRTSERRLALLLGDALTVTAAVLLALWTWSLTSGFPFDPAFLRARAVWLLAVPLWLTALVPTRDAGIALDFRRTTRGVARAAGALLVVYLAAFFYTGGASLPRLVAVYLLWDATLLLFGWRLVALWSLTRAPFSRRVLVAGSGPALSTALDVLQDPSFRDAEIVGVATTATSRPDGTGWNAPVVGGPDEVNELAGRLRVTDLVVAFEGRSDEVDEHWVDRLIRCQESGTHVVRMAQLYEDTLRRVPVTHVEPSWLLTNFLDVAPFREASPLAKRLFDVVVAVVLGAVGLILSPFIAVAILLEDGRPVFYRQERLGRGGRSFDIFKFRTMKHGAEPDGQPQWSTPGDPRVTRIGRLLRRTRLDELPNLLAVLRGEMSMVGPRPERPQIVERLEREVPLYRARLVVAPGLTGWAQVNWAYGDSVEDAVIKLEFDLYYIKHQSIWFDAAILLRTVGTMLRFRGR
jgi:exopolysaccharide biosynthesis polyprenyl glycosylphosphotransferase